MSDGLIGAASIFTWTSDWPIAVSSRFFSLSMKPKRDVNVTQVRQGIFCSDHLSKVGQEATVLRGQCMPRNLSSFRKGKGAIRNWYRTQVKSVINFK